MNNINELTGLFQLNKTLRFELRPIGRTLEHICKKGLITQDVVRAEDYKKVKEIIDRYHKEFIDKSLKGLILKTEDLEQYVELVKDLSGNEKEIDNLRTKLRKQIAETLKKQDSYSLLFKQELISKILPAYVKSEKEKGVVAKFSGFTTYFVGFNTNRKNLYSDEDKSTSIAHRIIHDNLPMFLDNIQSFRKIADCEVSEHFADIEHSFNDYINADHLDDVFKIEYFNSALTQKQIENYNRIIGGVTLEDGTKLQGINEYVNLYNQSHRDAHLPLLKPLYKMILSDRVALSWLPEEFTSDEEMTCAIKEAHESLHDILFESDVNSLRNLLLNIDQYDEHHIYIANDLGLTNISQHIFGQYDVYATAIKQKMREQYASNKKGELNEKDEEKINNGFKAMKSFSLAYLNACAGADSSHGIQQYFKSLGASENESGQSDDAFTKIEKAYAAAESILSGRHGNIGQSESGIETIKNLLDAYKSLQHFIKPLLGSGDEAVKDNEFYANLRSAWDALDIITPLYNKVRNWLTRKPYSTEKIKLNFENAQLLGGWDVNKEPDCTSILLRKDGHYYLAIMNKKYNHAFDIDNLPQDGVCYEKVDYKLLPGANKMLPKVFFSKSRAKEFSPSEALVKAYKRGTHKKGADFSITDCRKLIDFFKDSIAKHEDWKKFHFTFSPTDSYEDISGFYREIEQQGYMLGFRQVSESFINQLVDEGKLYLFQIWNKDFSKFSKGTPNMHTLYWKMLFDERNLADVVYKLNGKAEVFYRKRSLSMAETTIHKAHQPIVNKNPKNKTRQSTFDYDIIKNRRYTVDKFQFHVPISINFKASGQDNINDQVLQIIRNGGIEHIIGIDRGERHLLYISLIDLKGNIVKQMTLNDVVAEHNGNTYVTDYKNLLAEREGSRNEARKSWKQIDNIKDIKQGYLSQIVHTICKMMVEYKAIVVIEDLNSGFMRGRQKIERNVYEQFESKLIDKLNYYVDKRKAPEEAGGLLHALQLTSKPDNSKKRGTQCGCLFYIPAWNTSKIDPVTGFVNLLDTRYKNIGSAHEFFDKFKSICYNAQKGWFEFAFDYNDFTTKAEGTRTQWALCSHGTRIMKFRNPDKLNNWDCKEVNLTNEFKKAFADAGIDINGDIKKGIGTLNDSKHLENFMKLMKLLLQMRNSEINTDVDYMISPVADKNGNFYDSRRCNDSLPQDADANGAYNIARKGLWAVMQIKAAAEGKRPNLAIKNKDWLAFVQQKPYAK